MVTHLFCPSRPSCPFSYAHFLFAPLFPLFSVSMLSETSAVSLQPSSFKILQDDFVMLAPLGDHPHALGIQRFTPAFIQNMANRFNGFFARMGRLFSGAPTFEGHHDIEPDTSFRASGC